MATINLSDALGALIPTLTELTYESSAQASRIEANDFLAVVKANGVPGKVKVSKGMFPSYTLANGDDLDNLEGTGLWTKASGNVTITNMPTPSGGGSINNAVVLQFAGNGFRLQVCVSYAYAFFRYIPGTQTARAWSQLALVS